MDSYQLATGISKTTTTLGKSSGGFFRTIFSFLGRNKFWTFTFIVLLIILIGSFKESIETKSPEPLLFNFGGLVVVPDENLFNIIQNVEQTYPIKETIDGTTRWDILTNNFKYYKEIFKWWWVVFSNLWMVIAVGNLIRKLRIKFVNDSEKAKALLFSIKWMFIFYLATSTVFFAYHNSEKTLPSWKEQVKDVDFWISIVPFKGTISLFKHIMFDTDYFNAGYNRAKGMYNLTGGTINATGS